MGVKFSLCGRLAITGALLSLACLVVDVRSAEAQASDTSSPLLKPGDRVALLGGTFIERAQWSGMLESRWQCRRPDWKLSVRNLGWSGDDVHGLARKRFDAAEDGFQRMLEDVRTADPSVVLVAYGHSEASDGREAVDRFQAGLQRLVESLRSDDRRVVLVTPVAMPGFRVEGYGQWIAKCQQIVREVGKEMDVPVIDVDWEPSDSELTSDRLLPNGEGYAHYGDLLADPLLGSTECTAMSDKLPPLVAAKNQLFFHRYRPQNETYLYLFRKHEQGNNAAEIPQFDPLIEKAERAIWAEAQ